MASKLEMYSALADRTAHQITNSFSEWTAFLKTAARLYKYPFHEQLMIYAQKPDATACAEYDVWNQRMGRYVRRGSTGIALIDTTGNRPRLKYVFDLNDTGEGENSRYPHIWAYRQQYEDAVSKALENRFDVSGDEGLEVQLERAAAQLVDEYWNANQRDILGILENSFLEDYDDFNVGVAFRNAAVVSTTYMLMYRCGIDPSEHFLHEDFLDVFDFNTPSTLAALGTGISQVSETVLRQIEAAVKAEERKMSLTNEAERTDNHGQQPDLHTDRGLPGAESGPGRERDAALGQVREDAPGISSEGAPGPLERPHSDREAVPPLAGDRRDGGAALGGPDAEAGGGGRGDGGLEGPRPDEVGGPDEQLQSPGGGNDTGGADLQLTPQEPEPTATGDWLAEGVPVAQLSAQDEHGQFTLFELPVFPSEQEQISQIHEAESVSRTSSASFFSQEEIDHVLRLGSNTAGSRMTIAAAFQRQKSMEEITTLLRQQYYGGVGFKSENGNFSAWYGEDGLHLERGKSARYSMTAQIISWEDVAARVSTLMEQGRFATNVELAEADGYVKKALALKLLYVFHDFDEKAKQQGYLPSLEAIRCGNYPEEVEKTAALMSAPDTLARLTNEFTAFRAAYGRDRELLRSHYHKPDRILEGLRDLVRPEREYTTDMASVPALKMFITDDEIDAALSSRNFAVSKSDLCAFFNEDHTAGEKADYLRLLYGTGVMSNALSKANGSYEDFSRKGIKYEKACCDSVKLSWMNVVARVSNLIKTGRYFMPEEVPQWDAKQENPALDTAKRLINEYCQREFGDDADYSDLSKVGLAYTTTEEGELDVQVSADLVDFRMLYEVDGELVARVQFHDLDDLNEFLEDLDFSELVAFAEEHREKEQVVSAPPAYNAYNDIKEHRPDSIVLFQVGDFFEMYGEDAKTAAELLDLAITTRPIPGIGRLPMCGIPGHRLNDYVELLRDKYDVTVAALGDNGERQIITRLSFDHEAEAAIDAQEAVYGADAFGSRTLGTIPDPPEPYLPLRDKATQEDIDAAIQRWNGSIESKHAVVRYMERHGREKDTAAWLSREYGGAPALPLRVTLTGTGEEATLPWPKAQRRIAQLIEQDRFYTVEEQDRYDNIDPIAIREALAQSGIVNGEVADPDALANNPFIRQVREDVERITGDEEDRENEEIFAQYLPVLRDKVLTDKAYRNAVRNSDKENARVEGHAAVDRAAVTIQNADFMRLYYDTPKYHDRFHEAVINETYASISAEMSEAQEPVPLPDLSGQPIRVNGDTVTIGEGPATHEVDVTLTDEEYEQLQSIGKPLSPPYQVGDTVYLDNTAFVITEIRDYEVELSDPSLLYPIFRAESKEQFERLLRQDARNQTITDYLAVDLDLIDTDLQEILVDDNGAISLEEKQIISGLFRNGKTNSDVAAYLSATFAGATGTAELLSGDLADYFASPSALEIDILDNFNSRLTSSWAEIAPILRAMYDQERDGFTHEPIFQNTAHIEAAPALSQSPKGANAGPGNADNANPSVDTASPDEAPEMEQMPHSQQPESQNRPTYTSEPVAVYSAEENHLPFDVVVERLHFDEPERTPPTPTPTNFRITDDHLGEGGAKTKFKRNMAAITLLKELEFEGRQATPEEQAVLSQYVGWGGLADAFDEGKEAWASEFAELYEALSPEEYAAARASTLNAHYTSPTVIKAIYEAVGNMGFETGNILEPSMGVGNFFGLLPDTMTGSKLYGVELDSITGRIAKQLYPNANITVAGFEKTRFSNDTFDLAVGNVPFGSYKVNDPKYNKLGFTIHNYFAAKILDEVRPGGIAAFLTSRYTMDARDTSVREYLAQRADLLGAIRLPNNAFKANAGTEVVTDILFFQKREAPMEELPPWVQVGETEDGLTVNSYFIDHPEMVLGTLTHDDRMYGDRNDITCEPIPRADLTDQLHEAISHIHGQYRAAEAPELNEGQKSAGIIPADPNVKNFSFTVVDGEVYYREDSIMARPELNATAKERVKALVELRECVRELIDLQTDDALDSKIRAQQDRLNSLYDAFANKYGLINSRANRLAFSSDSSYYLLCALEVLDDEGRLKGKSDIFTKRTIKPHHAVTSVDTASEALAVSISERACVDLGYMASLMGGSEKIPQIVEDLKGVIFKDPRSGPFDLESGGTSWANGWQTADEYLSGNVRKKLREAEAAAGSEPFFAVNVEALRQAQPKDLDASEIEVRLGATWIDKSYIQQFMYETFSTPWYLKSDIQVNFSPYTAEWEITDWDRVASNNIAAYTTYGTPRASAYKILEESLNLRDVRIYDTVEDPDGKERRVINVKETTLAAQKQQAIKDAFRDWIWKDPERRQTLVRQYNEEMNCIRPREYDGSHIVFPGMNPEIELREHQRNAIAHVLYGGNTLLAHEVGAGKTFEMVASAMESKRLGLCSKSIIVVPNHLTEQWGSEFLRLYPSANILVTTKRDFETHRRKKFCARIATGDYDAIIIGHSQFEKIPISYERQERIIEDQIDEIVQGIKELERKGGEKFSVKQMERTKRGLESRLEKLQASHRKDDVISFEQLGVDRMFVDESDNYKNLFLFTKMRNVAGLSTSDAQKSSDMFAKCRYLDEVTGGRGVVFATGTPISNSMTEMYTIQRYLQYDLLQEMGMGHFDCWASRFGETVTAMELAPEGYNF